MAAKKLKKTEFIELNEAYQKMLHWFFSYPNRQIGLNDLSAELQISKTTAKRIVLQLVHEGFLKREILGRLWRISCVQQHIYNFTRKVCYNLIWVYESVILSAIHEIVPNAKSITLFGSYRKGDDTEDSDIDIAVEVLGDEEPKISQLGILPVFGYRKDIQVNLYVFSRNKVDLNLFANIANGIRLEGFLEARP